MVAFFSEAELLVLKTHTSIHRWATRVVANGRGVDVSALRRLSFLKAVRDAHGPHMPIDLLEALRILNDARNIVAHEESTGEIFIKVAELGRRVKGPTYLESPATADEANEQFREVLHFVEGWATHP